MTNLPLFRFLSPAPTTHYPHSLSLTPVHKKTAAGGRAAGGVADKPPAFNGVYLRVCVGGGGLIVRVAVDVCEGGREESVCFTIHTYDGTR